jgi:peroxiredoxin Q/BCP
MLKQGDIAPDFQLMDSEGNTISLSQFKGKKVVVYFYPKDGTSG